MRLKNLLMIKTDEEILISEFNFISFEFKNILFTHRIRTKHCLFLTFTIKLRLIE